MPDILAACGTFSLLERKLDQVRQELYRLCALRAKPALTASTNNAAMVLKAAFLLLRLLQSNALEADPPPLHDRLGSRVQTIGPEPSVRLGRAPEIWRVSPNGASAAGNVTVVVSGVALVDYGDVRCKFCSVEVRGHVLHSGAISCTAPPVSSIPLREGSQAHTLPTACAVDVTLHGLDGYTRKRHGAIFTYFNLTQVSIALMHPSGGPVQGGTLVRLEGTRFVDHGGGEQGAKCRFGAVVVPATIESHETARCISPAQSAAGSVRVLFTLNGNADEENSVGGLPFRYAAPATLSEIHPLGGPSAGGQMITLRGSGFVDDVAASGDCGMGDDTMCEMHRMASGLRRIDRPLPGLTCVFESKPRHNRDDDYRIPDGGSIAVEGTLAAGGTELLCRAPLTVRDIAQPIGPWCAQHGVAPHCDDPAYAESAMLSVALRVTLNGNVSDASPTALVYLLLDPELQRLHYAMPWGGPAAGGTHVHIVGENLLSLGVKPLCRFGHIEVPVVAVGGLNGSRALNAAPLHTRMDWHDARELQTVRTQTGRLLTCASPPGVAFGSRWVRIAVSLDGEHFSSDTVAFRYTSFSVSSAHPVGGSVEGGTSVVVHGHGFESFGGLKCRFGAVAVPASRIEPRAIRCNAPAAAQTATVSLSVSVNGHFDSADLEHGNVTFSYIDVATVTVSSLSPATGPAGGGTAITLKGAGFAVYGTVQCRFGEQAPVNASFASAKLSDPPVGRALDWLICYAPPHALDPKARDGGIALPVSVSLNSDGREFVGAGPTYFYRHPCHGRDDIDYYPDSPESRARTALERYLTVNAVNMTRFDVDADGHLDASEIHEVIRYNRNVTDGDLEAEVPADDVLNLYASSSCFLPTQTDGRAVARLDDTSFAGDETGGLLPVTPLDVYGFRRG